MKDYVYFDLETQRSFRDVGGYSNLVDMGVSIAVTYSTKTGKYHIYDEDRMQELIEQLTAADLVIGWNHEKFDYGVLQNYTVFELGMQTKNLDMMLEVEGVLGHRLKLDSVAESCFGLGKTGDGLDALRWWQEHKRNGDAEPLMKIAKYCCYDVKVTKAVHEFGMKNSFLKYTDKSSGELREIGVSWQ